MRDQKVWNEILLILCSIFSKFVGPKGVLNGPLLCILNVAVYLYLW